MFAKLRRHFFPYKEFSDDFVRYCFCIFSLPIKGEKLHRTVDAKYQGEFLVLKEVFLPLKEFPLVLVNKASCAGKKEFKRSLSGEVFVCRQSCAENSPASQNFLIKSQCESHAVLPMLCTMPPKMRKIPRHAEGKMLGEKFAEF